MVPSSLFILASSVCKSLQYIIFARTQGGETDHLFRLTCSVVLLAWRDTANKMSLACVGSACSVWTTLVWHSPRWHVLLGSALLRLHSDLQWHCPRWALHLLPFPGLSHSGSWVLCKGSDLVGVCVLCPSQVRAAQATEYLASALSHVDHAF